MKTNKGLMRLDEIIVAVLIFSVILVAGVVIISDINSTYNINIDESDFNNTLSDVNRTYNLGADLNAKTVNADISGDSTENALFAGGFTGARQAVRSNLGIISTALVELGNVLRIPKYMVTFAVTALSAALLFGLIYLVFRVIPSR